MNQTSCNKKLKKVPKNFERSKLDKDSLKTKTKPKCSMIDLKMP